MGGDPSDWIGIFIYNIRFNFEFYKFTVIAVLDTAILLKKVQEIIGSSPIMTRNFKKS